jgi:serine phosphatase RsbU (regulator of sigma subunit)/PAS domain-containing protein
MRTGPLTETPEPTPSSAEIAGLAARAAALRRASSSPGAEPGELLEAALAEVEGAVDLLKAGQLPPDSQAEHPASGPESAERQLLRAVFQDSPVPLFLVARDGIVQRINRSAGDLIGAQPGYATGRPFTAFVSLPSRAAVQSQLSAVSRTGRSRLVRCSLLAEAGLVPSELIIGQARLRGEPGPLIIAVRAAAASPAAAPSAASAAAAPSAASAASAPSASAASAAAPSAAAQPKDSLEAITRRLDLVTSVARLLLRNEGLSELRTLQRCARLIAGELAALVIVDLERRHRLRRQFVVGPDDLGPGELASPATVVDPLPESVPYQVYQSGHSALIAHAEDASLLGAGADGEPLLVTLNATSVLCVPLFDGETRYGALTLVRLAGAPYFRVAELGLVEGLAEQMALAIRAARVFRRRSDTADALHASLLPRRMPEIPGVTIAATYLASIENPEVGGDFYDAYQTPDGWGLAVGDVCGKGEEAAAVTAAARHAIRVLARRCADPAQVLSETNEILLADELSLDGGFVTASVAHLSWLSGKLRVVIASAGHPAAVLLRSDGGVRMMSGGGLPLGLFADCEPAAEELTLDVGDVLFLYTDGVAQARGPGHAYFHDRLADELAGLAQVAPDRLVAAMRQAVLDFTGGDLSDDLTMLAVRAGRPPKASRAVARSGAGPA